MKALEVLPSDAVIERDGKIWETGSLGVKAGEIIQRFVEEGPAISGDEEDPT
jgi:hypothetical protein